jgi:transglutaminase-like putative cysteine protease
VEASRGQRKICGYEKSLEKYSLKDLRLKTIKGFPHLPFVQNQPEQFHVSSELQYQVTGNATLLLNIQAAHTAEQTVLSEQLITEPQVPYDQIEQTNGCRLTRFALNHTGQLTIKYNAQIQKATQDINNQEYPINIAAYPGEVLPYLFPSRYCPSDKIEKFAQDQFSNKGTISETINAVMSWIGTNIAYLPGATDAHSTALDVIIGKQGVCRDYAHLGILFCRAMNIPARYYTGYAYQLQPQDFHACFEAWTGSQWQTYDATGLAPAYGLTRIGTGLDAADTSFANLYGDISFNSMQVNCTALNNT